MPGDHNLKEAELELIGGGRLAVRQPAVAVNELLSDACGHQQTRIIYDLRMEVCIGCGRVLGLQRPA